MLYVITAQTTGPDGRQSHDMTADGTMTTLDLAEGTGSVARRWTGASSAAPGLGRVHHRHRSSKAAAIGFVVAMSAALGCFIADAYLAEPRQTGMLLLYGGFLAASLAYALHKISDRSVLVTIGENGFHDARIGPCVIPWSDITDVKIAAAKEQGPRGQRTVECIALTLTPEGFEKLSLAPDGTSGAGAERSTGLDLVIDVDTLDTTAKALLREIRSVSAGA